MLVFVEFESSAGSVIMHGRCWLGAGGEGGGGGLFFHTLPLRDNVVWTWSKTERKERRHSRQQLSLRVAQVMKGGGGEGGEKERKCMSFRLEVFFLSSLPASSLLVLERYVVEEASTVYKGLSGHASHRSHSVYSTKHL